MVEIGYTFLSHLHQFYCMNWQPQCNRKKLLRLKVKAIIYYKGNEAQGTFFFTLSDLTAALMSELTKTTAQRYKPQVTKTTLEINIIRQQELSWKERQLEAWKHSLGLRQKPNYQTKKQTNKNLKTKGEKIAFFLKSLSTTPWDQVAVT